MSKYLKEMSKDQLSELIFSLRDIITSGNFSILYSRDGRGFLERVVQDHPQVLQNLSIALNRYSAVHSSDPEEEDPSTRHDILVICQAILVLFPFALKNLSVRYAPALIFSENQTVSQVVENWVLDNSSQSELDDDFLAGIKDLLNAQGNDFLYNLHDGFRFDRFDNLALRVYKIILERWSSFINPDFVEGLVADFSNTHIKYPPDAWSDKPTWRSRVLDVYRQTVERLPHLITEDAVTKIVELSVDWEERVRAAARSAVQLIQRVAPQLIRSSVLADLKCDLCGTQTADLQVLKYGGGGYPIRRNKSIRLCNACLSENSAPCAVCGKPVYLKEAERRHGRIYHRRHFPEN